MFYGLGNKHKQDAFKKALDALNNIYPHMYASDMLITFGRNRTFTNNKLFMKSHQDNARNDQEKSLIWRLHTLTWAAENAAHLEGDFVECGTFKGLSASVICQYLDFSKLDKTFFLYDTFKGLHEDFSTAEERQACKKYYTYDGNKLFKEVSTRFSKYPNVEVIQGVVPISFKTASPENIAFMHIDMNSEKAEIAALDALFERVVPGGIIVLDDFGWRGNRNQAVAELEFMHQRNHTILEMPTGQGLVIKHA